MYDSIVGFGIHGVSICILCLFFVSGNEGKWRKNEEIRGINRKRDLEY